MMKLYTWPTSPFGAKVKAVIGTLDFWSKVEIKLYHPWQDDSELRALNPLNKIPVLVLEDGSALYDSPVICEYLNDLQQGDLIPTERKFDILRIQALCDGILDAGVGMRYENTMRPTHLRSQDWSHRQEMAISEGLKALSKESFGTSLDLGIISTVITLLYIKLRQSHLYNNAPETLKTLFQIWERNPIFEKAQPVDNLPLPSNLLTLKQ